jgi:hypothetical protein
VTGAGILGAYPWHFSKVRIRPAGVRGFELRFDAGRLDDTGAPARTDRPASSRAAGDVADRAAGDRAAARPPSYGVGWHVEGFVKMTASGTPRSAPSAPAAARLRVPPASQSGLLACLSELAILCERVLCPPQGYGNHNCRQTSRRRATSRILAVVVGHGRADGAEKDCKGNYAESFRKPAGVIMTWTRGVRSLSRK